MIHASAFNLSLVLRGRLQVGTPRGLQRRKSLVSKNIYPWIEALVASFTQRWLDFGLRELLGTDKYFVGYGPLLLAACDGSRENGHFCHGLLLKLLVRPWHS